MQTNSRYFFAIIKYGSFSAAAKKLGITQPALSGYVAKLEEKMQVVLFDRSKSPVQLTEIGEIYYDYLRKAVSLQENFNQKIQDIENYNIGKITVAGAFSSNSCYLSRVTAEFISNYPNVDIKVVDGVVSYISEMASDDEIDFFITPVKKNLNEFEYIPILTERVFLCVPTNWNINDKYKNYLIPIDDLLDGSSVKKKYLPVPKGLVENQQFILLQEDTNIRSISDKIISSWKLNVTNKIVVSQMLTGFDLTVFGSGISFVTESVLRLGNFKNFPCIYALDETLSKRTLYICYKKGRYLSKACKCYIELLKNSFEY